MRYVALCVGFACLYGVLHDQITARVCLEYFTVWHPPLVDSQDPTVVALAWGIVATWWVGLILGVPLAVVCMRGTRPKLPVQALLPMLGWLFLAMAVCATTAGLLGYFLAPDTLASLNGYGGPNPRGFVTDLFAHNASYFSGFLGGIVLVVAAARRRRAL
jgi:hypothetical protein